MVFFFLIDSLCLFSLNVFFVHILSDSLRQKVIFLLEDSLCLSLLFSEGTFRERGGGGVCIAQFDSHSTHTDRKWALGAAAGFSRASTCWTYVEFRHVALRHMALEFVSFHVVSLRGTKALVSRDGWNCKIR